MKTLPANQVAQRLGVPLPHVYRLVREGALKGYKDTHGVRIFAESLKQYLQMAR